MVIGEIGFSGEKEKECKSLTHISGLYVDEGVKDIRPRGIGS